MTWPPSTAGYVAILLMLIGLVMLMSGRGAITNAGRIGLVIAGAIVLTGIFVLVVNRAL